MHNNILKKTKHIIRKPTTSPLLRLTQFQYKQLQNVAQIQGWGRLHYHKYRMLKVVLRNERERLHNKNWEKLIQQTARKYTEPPSFWTQIKKMRGRGNSPNQHFEVNNTKLTEDKDKEGAFRGIWSKVFTVTLEENAQYNIIKEREIEQYWENNEEQQTPFPRSNLRRVTGTEEINSLISTRGIKHALKCLKGESSINKIILKNLPDEALDTLKNLFNHTITTGYYPKKFKTAII